MVIEDNKKRMAGVKNKSNPALNLYEKILSFFTMRQGQTDNDN